MEVSFGCGKAGDPAESCGDQSKDQRCLDLDPRQIAVGRKRSKKIHGCGA